MLFDDKQTLRHHIQSKAAEAHKTLSNLQRFHGCSPRTKLHLFKTLVRPTITYCPLALSQAAKCHMLRLQRVQNRALRFVFNTNWREFKRSTDLHEAANLPPINTTLHNRLIKQLIKFEITHATTIENLDALPPYRRGFLLPANHDPPGPLYT